MLKFSNRNKTPKTGTISITPHSLEDLSQRPEITISGLIVRGPCYSARFSPTSLTTGTASVYQAAHVSEFALFGSTTIILADQRHRSCGK